MVATSTSACASRPPTCRPAPSSSCAGMPTMAIPTMAILTMAILTMAILTMALPRRAQACIYRAYAMHTPCLPIHPASCGVCSAAGSYHRDVGASPTAKFEARGCRVEALGGGRIMLDSVRRSVHVFGYSVGLGGDEGGPPGRGMPDHSQAATTYYGCTMATYSLTHSLAYSLTLTTHSLLAPGGGPRAPRAARSRGHLLRGGLLTLPSYRPTAVTLAAEGY